MDSNEVLTKLRLLVQGGNVNPIRSTQNSARDYAFFALSGKHKKMTPPDWNHFLVYLEACLRNGTTLQTAGIPLSDGTFVEMDKAKIGAAITQHVLESADAEGRVLKFTKKGWDCFADAVRER